MLGQNPDELRVSWSRDGLTTTDLVISMETQNGKTDNCIVNCHYLAHTSDCPTCSSPVNNHKTSKSTSLWIDSNWTLWHNRRHCWVSCQCCSHGLHRLKNGKKNGS